MLPISKYRDATHRLSLIYLLTLAALLAGCVSSHVATTNSATVKSVRLASMAAVSSSVPAIRQGRYTLVELIPDSAQRDLLQQVVDVTFPGTAHATVGSALRYLLLRSGYRLCDNSAALVIFDTLPLPAAHFHLGPVMLRDALQLLAGPAWQLKVDPMLRRICFAQAGEH